MIIKITSILQLKHIANKTGIQVATLILWGKAENLARRFGTCELLEIISWRVLVGDLIFIPGEQPMMGRYLTSLQAG